MQLFDEPRLISIVVPCYNEGPGIDVFCRKLNTVLAKLPNYRFEIVCVDDGSRDDTLNKLLTISLNDRRYVVIELSRNFGKESALTAGIDETHGDAVIPIDADLQDPPELIEVMIAHWEKGAEVVLAKRSNRDTDNFFKRITANLFYGVHNQITANKLPKNVGDFRLLDRVVVDALSLLPERQRFMKGLFAWVGYQTVTVEYVRQARKAGKTTWSGWRLWNFALEGITSFSTVPLRLSFYLGALIAFFTFTYAFFILVRTLIFGIDVPGYASLIVFILFFGSVQLISIGVIGEYVGRIYMEVKNRPLYLIRRVHGRETLETDSTAGAAGYPVGVVS